MIVQILFFYSIFCFIFLAGLEIGVDVPTFQPETITVVEDVDEVPLQPSSRPIPPVLSSFIKKRELEDRKPSIDPVSNSLNENILREQ